MLGRKAVNLPRKAQEKNIPDELDPHIPTKFDLQGGKITGCDCCAGLLIVFIQKLYMCPSITFD